MTAKTSLSLITPGFSPSLLVTFLAEKYNTEHNILKNTKENCVVRLE
jgi:hypothetical protein